MPHVSKTDSVKLCILFSPPSRRAPEPTTAPEPELTPAPTSLCISGNIDQPTAPNLARYLVVDIQNLGKTTLRLREKKIDRGIFFHEPQTNSEIRPNGSLRLILKQRTSIGAWSLIGGIDAFIKIMGERGEFDLNVRQHQAIFAGGEIIHGGTYKSNGQTDVSKVTYKKELGEFRKKHGHANFFLHE